jgi:hypothetical protein
VKRKPMETGISPELIKELELVAFYLCHISGECYSARSAGWPSDRCVCGKDRLIEIVKRLKAVERKARTRKAKAQGPTIGARVLKGLKRGKRCQ